MRDLTLQTLCKKYAGEASIHRNILMSRGTGVTGTWREKAFAVLDALELVDISNNIGDSKSLACHPASTTHNNMGAEGRAEAGVGEGMIRLNVGLEDPLDLIEDLDRGLTAIGR